MENLGVMQSCDVLDVFSAANIALEDWSHKNGFTQESMIKFLTMRFENLRNLVFECESSDQQIRIKPPEIEQFVKGLFNQYCEITCLKKEILNFYEKMLKDILETIDFSTDVETKTVH